MIPDKIKIGAIIYKIEKVADRELHQGLATELDARSGYFNIDIANIAGIDVVDLFGADISNQPPNPIPFARRENEPI